MVDRGLPTARLNMVNTLFRRDQFDIGEIAAIASDIARQQWQLLRLGMSTDEEIGQDAGANAARCAVTEIGLARQKQRGPRYRHDIDASVANDRIDDVDRGVS